MKNFQPLAVTLILSGMLLAGCHPRTRTEEGVMVGSGLGALTGGIIGHQSGNSAEGAILGAVAGGLAGAVIGNAEDERDIALAEASRMREESLTNFDLIRMTQSGVSDEVIINSVKTRGGQIDLSPDAIITLKNSGVSDKVILGIQEAANQPPPGSTTRIAPSRPNVVVVPPAVVGVGVYHHHPPHYYHRPPVRPRAGFSVQYSR